MHRSSYIVRNQFGAFCSACQSPLGIEEDDWDVCDACGGEGFGDDEDDVFEWDDYDPPARAALREQKDASHG